MQRTVQVAIDDVYVPAKRRKTLDPGRVSELAEDILEAGMRTPIMVRADRARWVLVEGLHRLEAQRALGETEIEAFHVQPRQF
jgi:ParB-like chromosome segregation protein Spo0J